MERLRNINDTYKIRNENEINPFILDRVEEHLLNDKKLEIVNIEQNSLSISDTLGKDILPKIKMLYERATQLFNEKGFADVKFLPVYLIGGEKNNNSLGLTTATHIEIRNLDTGGRLGTKQITFIKVLGHELYHSAAQRSIDIKTKNLDNETETEIISGGFGASYNTNEEDSFPALEEGLAVLFENKLFEQSKNDLPKFEIENYNESLLRMLRDKVGTKYKFYFNEDMVDVAHIGDIKNNMMHLSFSIDQYFSKKLAEYLIKEVPDFEKLVEDARLNRRTLGLAKAIEKRFGEGFYRRITTASTSEAFNLLKELGCDLSYVEFPNGSEVSEDKRQAAQELLNTNIFESNQKKANILLAAQGVKPVSEFTISYMSPKKNDIEVSSNKIKNETEEIQKILKKLGLNFIVETDKEETGETVLTYQVSLSQKNLEEYKAIKKNAPSPSMLQNFDQPYFYEAGRIFGFPETAIRAWCTGNSIEDFDEVHFGQVTTSRVASFIKKTRIFRLSVDNWKDEIKVVEKWVKSLDQIAPGYIDSLISQ